ncbi:hypothetical protein MVEN_01941900 [Mycena venus]|uniref:Expansin family protein n=1 Tax=Mycena venus TaxID=2733690 RepID=A0A8H6XFQ2_9AGAR|nr:hypothetical protein MVEN_01941900 [Mycena venus]
MFAVSSLVILLSAATAMANTHQARSHHALAKRVENASGVERRAQFVNQEFTWYPTDTGPDACTGKNHQDSDFFVAMGYNQFGDGSNCCGKQMTITVNGKTATATCVDECASCPGYGQLDFTKGLFEYFTNGDLDVGVIHGDWSFTDGSGGGSTGGGGGGDNGDDTPTTTTHHTTTSTHHTTTSTSTHHTTTTHVEAVQPTTTTHHSSSSAKASSSEKPSSSAKPSPPLRSPLPRLSPESTPIPTPTEGVANAGSAAGSSADSGDDTNKISGAIGQGSDDSSDAASLSFNKLFATVAVVALVAAQAL